MNEIDKKVIKFLLSAAVYSDNAIMKNLGISEEELKNSYITLEKEGYLESYSDYQSRQINSLVVEVVREEIVVHVVAVVATIWTILM